jgi:hypothetical protein
MQLTIDIKDKRRPARHNGKRVKRADEFKALPLADHQLTWAIGHNLQWVLSIVQTEGRDICAS